METSASSPKTDLIAYTNTWLPEKGKLPSQLFVEQFFTWFPKERGSIHTASFYPPTDVTFVDAFSWFPKEVGYWYTEERYWIHFNTASMFVSYILSPIIGVIRIIANSYFLAKNENYGGEEWSIEERGYLEAQIARGAFEVIGGGYFLWIVDLAVYICRKVKGDNLSEH